MSRESLDVQPRGFLDRHPVWVVFGIVAFGLLLRVYHIGAKSLWHDEAAVWWIASGTWSDVIALNVTWNSAPPLYALLLHLVMRLGSSEAVLRAIACVAGIAAIPAMYFLARLFLSRNASYFCALLVAVSSWQVRYSREVREYSLAFLLTILVLFLFVRFLRGMKFRHGALLALVSVIAVWTQYGLSLVIFGINLIVLGMVVSRKGEWRTLLLRWTLVMLPVVAAAGAVYCISFRYQFSPGFGTSSQSYGYLQRGYWDGTVGSLAALALRNTYEIFNFANNAPALLLFAGLVGCVRAWRHRENRVAVMILVLPMLVTFSLACARVYPYTGTRQDIFLTPAIYLIAGFGFTYVAELDKSRMLQAVLTILLTVCAFGVTVGHLSYRGQEHLRPVVETLKKELRPGDRIYVHWGAWAAFRYYWRDRSEPFITGVPCAADPPKCLQEVDQVFSVPGRAWLVFSHDPKEHCVNVVARIAKSRKCSLVASDSGAWLYLVE